MKRDICPHGDKFCGQADGITVLLYLAGLAGALWIDNVWLTAYAAIGFAWNMDSYVAHRVVPETARIKADGQRG